MFSAGFLSPYSFFSFFLCSIFPVRWLGKLFAKIGLCGWLLAFLQCA